MLPSSQARLLETLHLLRISVLGPDAVSRPHRLQRPAWQVRAKTLGCPQRGEGFSDSNTTRPRDARRGFSMRSPTFYWNGEAQARAPRRLPNTHFH